MQQESVEITYHQLLEFYAFPFLCFTLYNQTKTTTEIYDDKLASDFLASDFYYEVIQL